MHLVVSLIMQEKAREDSRGLVNTNNEANFWDSYELITPFSSGNFPLMLHYHRHHIAQNDRTSPNDHCFSHHLTNYSIEIE